MVVVVQQQKDNELVLVVGNDEVVVVSSDTSSDNNDSSSDHNNNNNNNDKVLQQPMNDHEEEREKKNGHQEMTNNNEDDDEQLLHYKKNNNDDNNDDDNNKNTTTKNKFPISYNIIIILFDLLFGVVIPLLSIILFSLLFGYILAKLEAPIEIANNNEKIAFRHALGISAIVQRIITKEVPKICLKIYLDNTTYMNESSDDDDDDEFLFESYVNYIYDDVLFKVIQMEATITDDNNNNNNNNINLTNYDDFLLLENNDDDEKAANNTAETLFTNTHPNNNNNSTASGGGTNDGYLDVDLMTKFMEKCGSKFDEVMVSTSVITILGDGGDVAADRLDELGDGITINWIKCNSTTTSNLEYNNDTTTTTTTIHHTFWKDFGETFVVENPSLTEIAVLNKWKQEQYELLAAKIDMYKDDPNMTSLERRERALNESLVEANGFEDCIPDTMAAAWFWFTVMTTIGYGNAAPQTDGGRALVYVFGFASIMYFAAVLGKAGDIVTRIVDDTVRKHPRLKFIAKDYVGVVMWGGLYHIWLFIVATCTVSWKSSRAEIEMPFNDAYWFSFISTTTVGLGDYYLEPSAIGFGAVMMFASLFLIGFVLLANFILNLTNLLKRTVFGSKNTDEYLHDGSVVSD